MDARPDPIESASADPARAARPAVAYLILTLAALMWGANAVAGKWAVGEVSPQVLTTLRWGIAFAVLAVLARRAIVAEWSAIAPRWRYVALMGAGGYTAFASLLYLAGTFTTATNLALFQGAIPVLVILLSFLVRGTRVTRGQSVGAFVTVLGAATAATHGDWSVLRTLSFNLGDGLMLAGCLFYAGYTVGLASRPQVSGLAFFTAMAAAAAATSLPLLAAEWASGHLIWPTPFGWAIVGFVALCPTLLSQLWFMQGVAMIGPNRAGLFVNLVPVFGAGLAILLVGEPFGRNEALALGLVLGGIAIAERFRPKAGR